MSGLWRNKLAHENFERSSQFINISFGLLRSLYRSILFTFCRFEFTGQGLYYFDSSSSILYLSFAAASSSLRANSSSLSLYFKFALQFEDLLILFGNPFHFRYPVVLEVPQ